MVSAKLVFGQYLELRRIWISAVRRYNNVRSSNVVKEYT